MIVNIIISVILLILIILFNIYQIKKHKNFYQGTLYNKSKQVTKISYLISVLLFIIVLILNIINYGNDTSNTTTIDYIINAIAVAVLALPLSTQTLYRTSFKDEEKICHKKTIVTNEINEKLIKKYNKAGINVIILTEEKKSLKIKTITESEIDKKILSKNLLIKTSNYKILDKIIDKERALYAFDTLEETYNQIKNARGVHDNYIRTIKYNIITYLSLILSFVFLTLMSFPTSINLTLIMIVKTSTLIISEFIYKKLPYDTDLMERKVKDKNVFIGKQEMLLTIFASFTVFFFSTIPYMFTLSQDGTIELANSLFYVIFIYSNLLTTLSLISENNILKNFISSLKKIRMVLYILGCIVFTIILNFTTFFQTKNIYLKNYLSCILFAIFTIIILELTKLARFTTVKGKKKNDIKNNKKYR